MAGNYYTRTQRLRLQSIQPFGRFTGSISIFHFTYNIGANTTKIDFTTTTLFLSWIVDPK